MFLNTYHKSCYWQTNAEGKITKVHLSPVVSALHNIIEAKYTNELTQLRTFKQTCETDHKDYAQTKKDQATLKAQTVWQNHSRINTFFSLAAGASLMAAFCWKTPFEPKFTALARYFGIITKAAAATVPTNVVS